MAILSRRTFFALAAGLVSGLSASGCGDAGTLAYFLMPEQRIDAKLKHLAVKKKDAKADPKVVIIPYTAALETRPEFINADRQLAETLSRDLKELARGSDERLTVVSGLKVEDFKSKHPNWKEMRLAEIGRKFDADYVIYLEIHELSLYERGSANTLMRGRTNITLELVNVREPDELPQRETYNCTYPGDAPGPVDVGSDMQPYQFREKFLNFVSRQLSHYFSKYPRDERYRME